MPDQKPTLDYGAEERPRCGRRVVTVAIILTVLAVSLDVVSTLYFSVGPTTVVGSTTTTQNANGVVTYNYHVSVTHHTRWLRWLELAALVTLACLVLVSFYRSKRRR